MEIQFLKDRAKEFWEEALVLKEKGKYNLAAFHIEQACQLWLKYLILKKVGDFPKTHYLSRLVKEFARAYDNQTILDFYQANELFFDDLEDAYFTSRYFPKTFSQNLVKTLLKSSQKLIDLTKEIAQEGF